MTFLEGIFVLYYLFFSPKETKQQRTRNWVLAGCSFFFVLAGMKRILLPALVVSAFYIWVLRRSHAKEKLIMLTGAAWVTLFWVYLYLVHTGAISRILNAVGVNMMGRDYIWSLAKPYYQFSPTFIGLGFEAVDAMVTRFYEIGLIDVAYPLHNDILKVFVELGFLGLCFWCAFLYLILPWFWTKRYGPEAGILYFAILNPLSMTYLTDNTAFYFWCTMGLRMIPLAVCCFASRRSPAAQKQTWQPPLHRRCSGASGRSTERKEVLHDPYPAVGQQHGPGRIESMLMNYYRHLDRTRFQFDFLVNKKKPGFFDDEIRALGGRIFQSPGVAPQSYPAYLRSMQQLLAQHPEIKVLHAHNEAMQLFALEGAKKAGLPVRIAHAHNTRLPKDAKLPIKWFCKQFIPGAATDYWACGREPASTTLDRARGMPGRDPAQRHRPGPLWLPAQVRAKLRAEYGLNDKLVVGCVARLMAQKNHTRLLDIFAALKKVRPDSCLLLVGEGELRAELEAKRPAGHCAGCEVPGACRVTPPSGIRPWMCS